MTSPSPRGQYEQSLIDADRARKARLYGKVDNSPVERQAPIVIELPAPPPKKVYAERCDRPYSSAVKEIIAQEMHAAGIGPEDFFSRSRRVHISRAKHMAAYRIHVHTDLSYPLIAKRIGWEDHTTAMHAIKKIEKEMAEKEVAPKNLATLELLAQGGIGPDEIIRQGYRFGVAVKDIARLAGKTKSAVVGKASRMGLRSPVADDPLRYRCRISDGQKERWARQKKREAMTA